MSLADALKRKSDESRKKHTNEVLGQIKAQLTLAAGKGWRKLTYTWPEDIAYSRTDILSALESEGVKLVGNSFMW